MTVWFGLRTVKAARLRHRLATGIKWGVGIDGEAFRDFLGDKVALSADGTILAISALSNDGEGGAYPGAGHVRVYQFDGGTWAQLGADIDG